MILPKTFEKGSDMTRIEIAVALLGAGYNNASDEMINQAMDTAEQIIRMDHRRTEAYHSKRTPDGKPLTPPVKVEKSFASVYSNFVVRISTDDGYFVIPLDKRQKSADEVSDLLNAAHAAHVSGKDREISDLRERVVKLRINSWEFVTWKIERDSFEKRVMDDSKTITELGNAYHRCEAQLDQLLSKKNAVIAERDLQRDLKDGAYALLKLADVVIEASRSIMQPNDNFMPLMKAVGAYLVLKAQQHRHNISKAG